jgi:catechol 2,3-dioxygenase-like lactoylglutathione lyase family enzyme
MNLLTLACSDVERMAAFFRALGWPEAPSSDEHYAVFQLENGVVLALWGEQNYVSTRGERTEGFRGFTLGLNVGSWEELEGVHSALAEANVVPELEEIQRADWGGGFTFSDPGTSGRSRSPTARRSPKTAP